MTKVKQEYPRVIVGEGVEIIYIGGRLPRIDGRARTVEQFVQLLNNIGIEARVA